MINRSVTFQQLQNLQAQSQIDLPPQPVGAPALVSNELMPEEQRQRIEERSQREAQMENANDDGEFVIESEDRLRKSKIHTL